jgi:hypothetical protein
MLDGPSKTPLQYIHIISCTETIIVLTQYQKRGQPVFIKALPEASLEGVLVIDDA